MIPKFHVMHVPGNPERDEIVQRQREVHPGMVHVHEDPTRRGILTTWLEALTCAKGDGTEWVMVIQDDAIPLPGWEKHLPQVLANAPAPVVSLCHFRDVGAKLAKRGVPFGIGTHTVWGQAVAYHESVLAPLIELGHDVKRLNSRVFNTWDDRLPGVLNMLRGHGYTAVTARALFDHPHLPSLVGHASAIRRHPQLTIEHDGPDWDAHPRYFEYKTKPHGIMVELVNRLKAGNA